MLIAVLLIAALWVLPVAAQPPEVALVMVEEEGCVWCARWDREIASAYPNTSEGRAAPLRRINLRGPVPEDLDLDGALTFTPTFILVVEGHEVARIEGYPGDEFFWQLLGIMLRNAGVALDDSVPARSGP